MPGVRQHGVGDSAGAEVVEYVDGKQHVTVANAGQLDRTALLAMLAALRQAGLFGSPEATHTVDEVLAVARVAPRHARLIRIYEGTDEMQRLIISRDLLRGFTPVGL